MSSEVEAVCVTGKRTVTIKGLIAWLKTSRRAYIATPATFYNTVTINVAKATLIRALRNMQDNRDKPVTFEITLTEFTVILGLESLKPYWDLKDASSRKPVPF